MKNVFSSLIALFVLNLGIFQIAAAATLHVYLVSNTKDEVLRNGIIANIEAWKHILGSVEISTHLKVEVHEYKDANFGCDEFYRDTPSRFGSSDVALFIYSGHGYGQVKDRNHSFPHLDCPSTGNHSAWLEDIRDFFVNRGAKLTIAFADACNFVPIDNEPVPAYAYKAYIAQLERAGRPDRLIALAQLESIGVSNLLASATDLVSKKITAGQDNKIKIANAAANEAINPTEPGSVGLMSLFESYSGWVIGAGTGQTELSYYYNDGGAYTKLLTETIKNFGEKSIRVKWEDILGYVTSNINMFGFPNNKIVLVNGKSVYHPQKPMYDVRVSD